MTLRSKVLVTVVHWCASGGSRSVGRSVGGTVAVLISKGSPILVWCAVTIRNWRYQG